MRRGRQRTLANPVLIGALTLLVAIVAVALAYTTTNALPFVPMRELKLDLASGAALGPGDDVRQGGFRVGFVSDLRPVELANGTVGAQATLRLSQANGHVPLDSTATVRPRSVLGLKYVELTYGHSHRIFPPGGTMPLAQTTVPVQFDDLYKMFDARTRPAFARNLVGIGDALSARGSSLNDTIASLPALLEHVRPVAQYLSDPHTQLTRLLVTLGGFFKTLSPVAETEARLVGDQASTFEAISRDPSALEAALRESPPTLDTSTASLRVQQRLLADLIIFGHAMGPVTAELVAALPKVNPALEAGVRALPRTVAMDAKLQGVLGALDRLAEDPGTNVAVNGVVSTVTVLKPTLRYLGPYVTVCNGWNYLFVELQDLISEQTNYGMAQRALINFTNQQKNSLGSVPADQPANGENVPPGQVPEFLHGPPYAAAVDTHGRADCEVGQRGFVKQLNKLDPRHRNFDAEQYTPNDQGPTWSGLSRVPPGETFSRRPTVGPQLQIDANNP